MVPPSTVLISYGINLPAAIFKALGVPLRSRLGFWPEEALFFVGVVVWWYWVGRAFDQRWFGTSHTQGSLRIPVAKTAFALLVIVLGVTLLGWSVSDTQGVRIMWDTARVFVVLMLAWSAAFVVVPAWYLLSMLAKRRART